MNRKRKIQKKIYVDENENKLIRRKMEKANKENFGSFAREILLTGEINLINFDEIKKLRYELNRIGNNINQIVKRANEDGKVEKSQLVEILKFQNQLEEEINKLLNEKIKRVKENGRCRENKFKWN